MTRPRIRALLDDVVDELALVEVEHPAGALGGQGVVGDHDDRLLELAVELLEQVEDLAGRWCGRGRRSARRRRAGRGR